MKKIQAAWDEETRQQVVAAYPLEGAHVSDQLDRIADVAAKFCDAPIGIVSLVESDIQRFIGKSGTTLDETPREASFCQHTMVHSGCMVVADATRDPRFADNPLVTGEPGIRFYAGVPLVSSDGLPLGALCVIDPKPRDGATVGQCEGLEALAIAVMAILERERVAATHVALKEASRIEIDDREQRFNLLADSMPQLVWSTNAAGMADYYNLGWCRFTGKPPEVSYGTGWLEFLHPDDRPTTFQSWENAVASGEPYEVNYRLRNSEGEYRWVLARGVPMKASDGEILRWFGTCTDIHEQKRSEDQLQVFSRELNHRIKNIFAVIGGLVSLTSRQSPAFRDAGSDLQDRILALGRAHDFVRSHGGLAPGETPYTSLKGMLEVLLEPYQDDTGNRIHVIGPDVPVDDRSATPLALYIHELATNSAKYGAFSEPAGKVTIALENGSEVEILWQEAGGPPVSPPDDHNGFGASLVQMSIARQLGGSVEYDWQRGGLQVRATIPPSAMHR